MIRATYLRNVDRRGVDVHRLHYGHVWRADSTDRIGIVVHDTDKGTIARNCYAAGTLPSGAATLLLLHPHHQ